MTRRLLFRNGTVLTLARTPNLTGADVLVEDGRIAEVGRGLRVRDAEVVDASDHIVMPGFVDGHQSLWRSLLRHLDGGAGANEVAPAARYGPHYEPDDLYAATLLGLHGALQAGTTTVVDWCDLHLDDRYTQAALQAHADAGLRTVLVHASPRWASAAGDATASQRFAARQIGTPGPTTTLALGTVLDQDAPAGLAATWSAARAHGVRVHALAGTSPSGAGAVSGAASQGLLAGDVTLVHGTHLDDGDLAAVAAKGTGLVLTPSHEMANGIGSPPLQGLIDRGIRPGLGVGEGSVVSGDLFSEMRAAQSVQHATLFDLKHAGKGGVPSLLNTRDVIRYATADGARAIGLGESAGTLEVGKQADLVLLRTDLPNIFPVNDPIGAVVWGMDASNVDWVVVGGRVLLRDGALEADVQRTRALAIAAWERVAGAAGRVAVTTTGGPA
jgi:5-methylthioadenosine/S-adenosylhomocysteine deaminase